MMLVSRRDAIGGALAFACGSALTGSARARQAGAGPYACPPCGCAKDDHLFDGPGLCPACGMDLVPAPRPLSVAAMRDDLRFLRRKILEQHANPFLYIARQDFERRYRTLAAGLDRPLGRIEFYRRAAALAASLKDAHTIVEPLVDDFRAQARSGGVFPLSVRFIGERLFVAAAPRSEPRIGPGVEILAVDGRSVAELVDGFRQLINDVRPLHDVYARLFRELFWLRYGARGAFAVDFGDGGRPFRATLPAASGDAASAATPDSSPLRFELVQDGRVGLLTVDSFAPAAEFSPFLERSFDALRASGAQALVIDIRRNGGGSGRLAQELIGYLTDRPYAYIARFIVKVTRDLRALYRRGTTHTDEDTRRIVMATPIGARVDALASTGPAMVEPPARRNRFAGRVLVLTGNNTLSAAAMFAAAVKCNGIAELVGREPGQATSFLADALPLALPRSGLAFTVSFSEIHMPCDQSYVRGVQPNHPVETTAEHLRIGADPDLDLALRLAVASRRDAARM